MTRASDDELALAETHACSLSAVLVPELGDTRFEAATLGDKRRIVALGEGMENLTPLV